jgi:hypothetical protein
MTLEWFKAPVVYAGQRGWSLRLTNGTRFLATLGMMYPIENGYVIFHTPGSCDPCYLPADLTLDEAKSAAKLILATGGEHGQR